MLPKNNKMLGNAKKLRKEMTAQEKHLWYDFLRQYPLKIYKQRIIGNYIVDFYCASAKLVIELDGSQHYTEESQKADKDRDAFLKRYGLSVIRISNFDLDRNFENICLFIDKEINKRCFLPSPSRQSRATSPKGGGST